MNSIKSCLKLCPIVNHDVRSLPVLGHWSTIETDFKKQHGNNNGSDEENSDDSDGSDAEKKEQEEAKKEEDFADVISDLTSIVELGIAEADFVSGSTAVEKVVAIVAPKLEILIKGKTFGLLVSTKNVARPTQELTILQKSIERFAKVSMEPVLLTFYAEINFDEPNSCTTEVLRFRDEDIEASSRAVDDNITTKKRKNEEKAAVTSSYLPFYGEALDCVAWRAHEEECDPINELNGLIDEVYVGYAMIVESIASSSTEEDQKKQKLDEA